jgi:hypothetical protein
MLSNYENLLSELKKIKESINHLSNLKTEQEFFETTAGKLIIARLFDTLSKLFQHEPNSKQVIEKNFRKSSVKEITALIDHILEFPPSIRHFIRDDSDTAYLQQLVDMSVTKSRVFRLIMIPIAFIGLLALSLLGISTERTFSYADKARQTVQDAQGEFEAQQGNINRAKILADSVISSANNIKSEMEKEKGKIDEMLRMLRDENSNQFVTIRQLTRDFEQQKNEMKMLLKASKTELEVWPEKLQANQEFIKVEQEKIRTDVAEQISKNSTTVSNASRNAIIVIENNKKQIIDTVKVELNDIDAHVKLVADAQEKVDNTMSKINELSRELNNGNGKVLEELSHAKLSFIKLEGEMSYLKQKIRNEVTLLNQINNKRDNASETLQKMLDERPNATLARHWEILETNTQVQFYLGINVFLIFYIGLRAYLFRKKTLKSSQ